MDLVDNGVWILFITCSCCTVLMGLHPPQREASGAAVPGGDRGNSLYYFCDLYVK